jgi:hypothetical protein
MPRTLRTKPSPSRLILLGSYVPPEHACRLASALAASGVPHAVTCSPMARTALA